MSTEVAGPDGSALSEQLGLPAQPLRYYCNKCGHMGEQGPEHDVCAGYPQQRCPYSAVSWGPFWSTDQLSAAVAAERERLKADAENWGNALNEAGWAATDAYRRHTGQVEPAIFFNYAKAILRDALAAYFKALGA